MYRVEWIDDHADFRIKCTELNGLMTMQILE